MSNQNIAEEELNEKSLDDELKEIYAQHQEEVPEESDEIEAVEEESEELDYDEELYNFNEDYRQAVDHGWRPGSRTENGEWKDYKAFNAYYNKEVELREAHKDIQETKRYTRKALEMLNQRHRDDLESQKTKLMEELQTHTDNFNMKEALDTKDKIQALDQQLAEPEQIPDDTSQSNSLEDNWVVKGFRQANPEILPGSSNFNPDIYNLVNSQAQVNLLTEAQKNGIQSNAELSDETIQLALTQAYQSVKLLTGNTVSKQKAAPKTFNASKKKKAPTAADKLKNVDDETRNVYNKFKKDFGEDFANDFLDRMAGGQ